jgi:hypothetical protein
MYEAADHLGREHSTTGLICANIAHSCPALRGIVGVIGVASVALFFGLPATLHVKNVIEGHSP